MMYQNRPGNIRSLSVLIQNDIDHEAQNAYFGSALWSILQYLAHGESQFPRWSDLFEQNKREEKKETADEIKNRIVREMRR